MKQAFNKFVSMFELTMGHDRERKMGVGAAGEMGNKSGDIHEPAQIENLPGARVQSLR